MRSNSTLSDKVARVFLCCLRVSDQLAATQAETKVVARSNGNQNQKKQPETQLTPEEKLAEIELRQKHMQEASAAMRISF